MYIEGFKKYNNKEASIQITSDYQHHDYKYHAQMYIRYPLSDKFMSDFTSQKLYGTPKIEVSIGLTNFTHTCIQFLESYINISSTLKIISSDKRFKVVCTKLKDYRFYSGYMIMKFEAEGCTFNLNENKQYREWRVL